MKKRDLLREINSNPFAEDERCFFGESMPKPIENSIQDNWVTNIYDYRRDDAMNTMMLAPMGGTQMEQWQRHLEWVKQFAIGRPQANEHFTQKEFEEMGMIGLYKEPQPCNE